MFAESVNEKMEGQEKERAVERKILINTYGNFLLAIMYSPQHMDAWIHLTNIWGGTFAVY